MALDKDKIKGLLGRGLSNSVVANAVGCEPAYITQLLASPEFAEEVTALRAAALTANTERDLSIDGLEDTIIVKLKDAVEQMYKPNELLQAFRVVNAAKRRGVAAQEAIHVQNNVVNLTLPEVVVKKFTINQQGEVVDVEGQTMVTMPASQLLRSLAREGIDGKRYEKVARYLPGSTIQHGVSEK